MFDLWQTYVLCAKLSLSKTPGRALGVKSSKAQRTTVCHLEERGRVCGSNLPGTDLS